MNTYPTKTPLKDHGISKNYPSNIADLPLTKQFVVPPARVWEKIESILNQQEKDKYTNILFSTPSHQTKSRFSFYVAAVSVTALAGLVWVCR